MRGLVETVQVIGICALLVAGSGCVRSGFQSWSIGSEPDAASESDATSESDAAREPDAALAPDAAHDAGMPLPRGDLDGDGCVGCADLEIFHGEFGRSGPGLVSDFDGDGVVSAADFAVLLEHWSEGCSQPPTWSLTLHLSGFDSHIGRTLRGTLFGSGQLPFNSFTLAITAASSEFAVAQGLEFMQPHWLHLYLDLDGNARCGSADLAWMLAPDPQGCAVELPVTPPGSTSTAACVGFAITGDVTGDGCVSAADLQYVNAEIFEATPDPAADINGDGLVNVSDLTSLDANMGIGCPQVDGGPGDGAAIDANGQDAIAGDGGDR